MPVFWPEKSHGQSSLMGYRPRGHKELGTTEQLSTQHSRFTMLCWLIYSKVTQLHTYIHSFYILFHYGLSQEIEYSSLCYTLCCSITQSWPLFVTPWTVAHQASLSFTIFQSLLKLMSTESMMPSNHLVLCPPLLLLPSVLPSLRVFSN